MKIVFLNSHPIAYKSDMYRYLSNKTSIEVWYCSKYGLKSHFDKEFNTYRSLDGLINGFDHKFLINLMPNSSAREKFFDSINPSIFLELLKLRKGDFRAPFAFLKAKKMTPRGRVQRTTALGLWLLYHLRARVQTGGTQSDTIGRNRDI